MFELKNKYICDYWFDDNIIDCGKPIDDLSDEIPVIIFNSEINIISQNHVEHLFEASNTLENNNVKELNEEKLNYNYKISNTYRVNEYRTRKNRSNSRSNTSDISTRNTEYYHRFKTGGQIISNNRMFDKEKTSQHHKLFYQSCTNNDKRKMHSLPKTSRLYEFKTGKRKVLLDSLPKPKSLI
jgi:hypothetical protein